MLIRVFDRSKLFVGQGDQFDLFISGEGVNLGNIFSDISLHNRENGVIGVITVSSGQGLNSDIHHLIVNLLSVRSSKSLVHTGGGILDDLGDLFILIHLFISFGGVQNIQGSFVDMSLEILVFVDEEVVDGFGFDALELAVNMPEFHLGLRNSDKFSEFIFNIFVVENFEIVDFVGSDSSVESDEEGLEEGLSSFKIDVHDLHPEEEGEE